MSWSITDYFPSWGDSGEQPSSGFNYQGGDQVNEKHIDYLWSSLHDIQTEIQAALDDIDSDSDGIVDEADYANDVDSTAIAGDGLKVSGGDLLIEPADFAGSGLQDDGSDNLALSESSLSVNAGDGLKGGGSVALGGSTTLNVEPADFAGSGLLDDGNDNLAIDSNAVRQEEWVTLDTVSASGRTFTLNATSTNYDNYRVTFEYTTPSGTASSYPIYMLTSVNNVNSDYITNYVENSQDYDTRSSNWQLKTDIDENEAAYHEFTITTRNGDAFLSTDGGSAYGQSSWMRSGYTEAGTISDITEVQLEASNGSGDINIDAVLKARNL